MDKETFVARVKTLDIPYTESEFKERKNSPPPDPPYICYLWHETTVGPDFYPNMLVEVEGVLELYVHFDSSLESRDTTLEEQVEKKVFFDIPYVKEAMTISEENLVQVIYEFDFKEKR